MYDRTMSINSLLLAGDHNVSSNNTKTPTHPCNAANNLNSFFLVVWDQ
jgi:hypothetical protein